jgi:hypothetical protein
MGVGIAALHLAAGRDVVMIDSSAPARASVLERIEDIFAGLGSPPSEYQLSTSADIDQSKGPIS